MSAMTCSVDGCDGQAARLGLCWKHVKHWQRHGTLDPLPWGRTARPCGVDGCDRIAESRGMCAMHYQRWTRHGDPTVVGVPGRKKSAPTIPQTPAVRAAVGPAVPPIPGATPVTCDTCGRLIAADDTAPDHAISAARANHRRYCQGGVQ